MREAAYVSQFARERQGRHETNAPECHKHAHGFSEAVLFGLLRQLFLQSAHFLLQVRQIVQIRLQGDLVRSRHRQGTHLGAENPRPDCSAFIPEAPGLNKGQDTLLGSGYGLYQVSAAAQKRSHSFPLLFRHAHRGQQPSCILRGQLAGIPPVGLDALARSARDR